MQIVMIVDEGNKLKMCFGWLEQNLPEVRPITDGAYRWSFKPSPFDNGSKQYLFYFKHDRDAQQFIAEFGQ